MGLSEEYDGWRMSQTLVVPVTAGWCWCWYQKEQGLSWVISQVFTKKNGEYGDNYVQYNVVSLQILSIWSVRSQLNILFWWFSWSQKLGKLGWSRALAHLVSRVSVLSVSWEAALETTHRDSCGQRGSSEWRLYCNTVTLQCSGDLQACT